MNDTLQQLANEGCSIEEALERIGGDESFLLTCIDMVINDDSFEDLGASIAAGDIAKSFEAAHSLKGICANTGLDPLTAPSSEITEVLRANSMEGVEQMYADMMDVHARLLKILE